MISPLNSILTTGQARWAESLKRQTKVNAMDYDWPYLKDGEQGNRKAVEIGRWRAIGEVESATEQLHAQQGEDQDEQKEEEQQRQNRAHRAKQRYHQIPQRWPIPARKRINVLYQLNNLLWINR